jgi:hypothetical protein
MGAAVGACETGAPMAVPSIDSPIIAATLDLSDFHDTMRRGECRSMVFGARDEVPDLIRNLDLTE